MIASRGEATPRHAPGALLRARGTLGLTLALALLFGPGVRFAQATEPPAVPSSFREVAATALAASFVIRVPAARTSVEDSPSIQSALSADEDVQDDGGEPFDPVAELRNRTIGAGVVIDASGIALTSTRVMLRAPEFEVVMMDGTAVNATVVGLDLRSDVAVLRLGSRGAPFPHLPLGDPGRVQIGDWVISVGAPLGLEGTVVAGVITARPEAAGATALAGYLQSDAVMARGNAGGPLVDMNGQLVGIGTIVGGDESAYAIPAKTLRRIAFELLEFGRARRPWLGITTQSLDARLAHAFRLDRAVGALVSNVVAGGPGATAGLRPGDIVVGVGTIAIATRLQFERALATHSPGDVVTLKLSRAGRPLVLSATSSEDPQDLPPPPDAARAKRRLGIDVRALNPTAGAVVRDIEPSSPAGLAGILSGDVIHEVDGKPIRSPADFRAVTRTLTPDAPVLMRVQRRDVVLFVVVSGAHRWTEVGDARRRAER